LRREKTSVSQEDYLKAIWEMLQEDQMPISARLAEELNVTPPAVTAALKRMTRDGHVRVERSGRIDLTKKGRKRAEHLALRHQLAEMLLTEVIGLSWAKAHDEAEQLEHAISPEVEALLLKRFGDKKSCPHGVPMRGGIAQLRKQGAVLLADLRAKEAGEILCVYEKDARRAAPAAINHRRSAEARVRRNDDAAFQREDHAPRQACHQPHLGEATQFVEEAGRNSCPPPPVFRKCCI
jgi:DtxR family Mn-dependent transcriptional regulator